MKTLNGKHIWIIGASSGIGAALARELSNRGAHLILSARSADKLHDLNTALEAPLGGKVGGTHKVLPVDVSDLEAMRSAAENLESIDSLDSVVFLAAVYSPHDGKQKEMSFVHKAIAVNLGGAFNTVNVAYPLFMKQKFGQILLCGSVAGYRGLPHGQPYCATKAAIINYAESLRVELAPSNIDVKLISPGFVKTPLTDKNEFPMPMMIDAQTAARAIADGMGKRGFEIHFPKRFTVIMKTLRIMPNFLYFKLSNIMRKKQ